MDSHSHEPIRLTEGETELLTRALVDARDQAELPFATESETQILRRSDTTVKAKVGNTQQITRDGNMIF